jgi:hypothetical protein
LQYAGQQSKNDGIFYGSGDQTDKKHYVFSCSGAASAVFFNFLMGLGLDWEKVYCTRIDLQQTIRHPKDLILRKVFKTNPRITKMWIESDTDTIYIGARTSDVYTRLYQKLAREFLRLEHEFKGSRARAIFFQCLTVSNHVSVIQQHFVSATKRCKFGSWVWSEFELDLNILELGLNEQKEELEDLLEKKRRYLNNTETAISRYLDDDDLSQYAREIVERLYEYSNTRD